MASFFSVKYPNSYSIARLHSLLLTALWTYSLRIVHLIGKLENPFT